MNNDFHFKISTESKTYEFDLHATSTSTQSGFARYSITSKNESDIEAINKLLQHALEDNPASVEEISRRLEHLPDIKQIEMTPTSKTHALGKQVFGAEKTSKATPMSAPGDQRVEQLTAKCEEIMHRLHIPGMSISVVKNEEMVNIALGICNTETQIPVRKDTIFEACSLSKQIFTELVFSLVESKELDLDEPLHEFFSDDRISHDPRHKQLTARMVLSHQTGLPNWGADKNAKLEFLFDPGKGFGYSGEGFGYLQKVIEKKLGKPLDELAEERIFKPLGMTHSHFSWPEREEVSLPVTGHTEIGTPTPKRIPSEAHAAASFHCSVSDFSKFLKHCLARETFPETMLKKENKFVPAEIDGHEVGDGKTTWGLGWGVQSVENGVLGFQWGDNGPFKAFVVIDIETKSAVAGFFNSANGLMAAPEITCEVLGSGTDGMFDWLDYGHYSLSWQEFIAGKKCEASHDYGDAIKHFEASLKETTGKDGQTFENRVKRLERIIEVGQNPIEISADELKRFTGHYGVLSFEIERGSLTIQFPGASEKNKLIYIGERKFLIEGNMEYEIFFPEDDQTSARVYFLDGSEVKEEKHS